MIEKRERGKEKIENHECTVNGKMKSEGKDDNKRGSKKAIKCKLNKQI
jgi:hypothetical protein